MEYELFDRNSYFETYMDDIVTGSMLPTGSNEPYGKRGRVGSVVTGSYEFLGGTLMSTYYKQFVYKFYRSGMLGFTQFFSKKERIYDTMMPNFTKIIATDGVVNSCPNVS